MCATDDVSVYNDCKRLRMVVNQILSLVKLITQFDRV